MRPLNSHLSIITVSRPNEYPPWQQELSYEIPSSMNVHASIPIPYTPVPIHTHTYTRIHAPRGIVYTPVYTSSSTGLNTKHSSRLITLQPPIKQQRLRTVTINDNGRLNGGNGAPRMKRSGDMISRSFSAIINALCLYEPHFSPSLPLSLSLLSIGLSAHSLAKRSESGRSPWRTAGAS